MYLVYKHINLSIMNLFVHVVKYVNLDSKMCYYNGARACVRYLL